jgi:death-on-curing protein
MRYLTAEEILILHALVVDETGGSHGVRDPQLLLSIAHKPQTRFGNKELYRGVFLKTAVLLEAVANYHVFVDGNKRTSLIVASRFLYLNGYQLTASNTRAERAILAVATKKMDIQGLSEWLKKNSRKIRSEN